MEKPLYESHSDSSGYVYFQHNVVSESSPLAKITLHIHNAVEFKFITKGNYWVEVAGKRQLCKAGDVVFVDSNRPHTYMSIGESEHYVLVFAKEVVARVCNKNQVFPFYMPDNENFKCVEGVLNDTYSKWEKMSQEKRRGFVYRLVGTMAQYYDTEETQHTTKEDLIAQILEYIDIHYNETITLENLSKAFGYSKNYFSNIFHKYIKMGLRECVNRNRINKAVAMMKEGNGKIPKWRVAESCGYDSLNTFRRAYKRYANEELKNGSNVTKSRRRNDG